MRSFLIQITLALVLIFAIQSQLAKYSPPERFSRRIAGLAAVGLSPSDIGLIESDLITLDKKDLVGKVLNYLLKEIQKDGPQENLSILAKPLEDLKDDFKLSKLEEILIVLKENSKKWPTDTKIEKLLQLIRMIRENHQRGNGAEFETQRNEGLVNFDKLPLALPKMEENSEEKVDDMPRAERDRRHGRGEGRSGHGKHGKKHGKAPPKDKAPHDSFLNRLPQDHCPPGSKNVYGECVEDSDIAAIYFTGTLLVMILVIVIFVALVICVVNFIKWVCVHRCNRTAPITNPNNSNVATTQSGAQTDFDRRLNTNMELDQPSMLTQAPKFPLVAYYPPSHQNSSTATFGGNINHNRVATFATNSSTYLPERPQQLTYCANCRNHAPNVVPFNNNISSFQKTDNVPYSTVPTTTTVPTSAPLLNKIQANTTYTDSGLTEPFINKVPTSGPYPTFGTKNTTVQSVASPLSRPNQGGFIRSDFNKPMTFGSRSNSSVIPSAPSGLNISFKSQPIKQFGGNNGTFGNNNNENFYGFNAIPTSQQLNAPKDE